MSTTVIYPRINADNRELSDIQIALRNARTYNDSEPVSCSVHRLIDERNSARRYAYELEQRICELESVAPALIEEKQHLHSRCGNQRRELRRINQNYRMMKAERDLKARAIEDLVAEVILLRRQARVSKVVDDT